MKKLCAGIGEGEKDFSGTYVLVPGEGLKRISDKIPGKHVPDWGRKMDPQEEMRRGYESLEAQGKLKECDDREVQAEALRR